MRLVALVLVACSPGTPAQPKPAPIIERVETPKPTGCEGIVAKAILAPKGTPIELAGDKVLVFQGSSLDHFANGTAAIMLELAVAGSSWLPDSGDTAFHKVAGICIRVVKLASEDKLELEIDATALPRERDCKKQCCTTPESRQPAPDGTVECCMCPATD
ncbi:MAG TPA: hypothetical protein VIU61_11780 [Kofleriaceae bacterium]